MTLRSLAPPTFLALFLSLTAYPVAHTDPGPIDLRREDPLDADPLRPVRTALLDGRGEDAARQIAALLGKHGDDELLLFLEAAAHRLAGESEQALSAYERLLEEHPGGVHRFRASFARADLLARAGRLDEAVSIYEAEVLRITGVERRQELAGIYIRFADAFFAGEGRDEPAWDQARDFYQRALEIGPDLPEVARLRLRIGLCHVHMKAWDRAASHFESELRSRPDGPLADQMAYHLGLARLEAGDPTRARRVFVDLLADHPQSELRPEVQYQIARTHGLPTPADDEKLEQGVRFLRMILEEGSGPIEIQSRAALDIGLAYFHRGKDEEAISAFLDLRKRFGDRPGLDEVPMALVRAGDAYFRQGRFEPAAAVWKEFLAEFSAHHEWRGTQRKIIDLEYSVGLDAFARKDHERAITAWSEFLERYPLDERSPHILLLIGKIHYESDDAAEAVRTWKRVVSKYPGTETASEAQYWIGVAFEKKLSDFEKARQAYRELTWGAFEGRARARLEAMDSRHLTLLSERSFRTTEPAVLALTVRNIRELEFHMVRLDGEAYFTRMHSFSDMERLDLALIEADERWTVPVPDYRPGREIETRVTLPFSGEGIYVVTASDGELEATTVVLVTDIAIAVKSGRRDLLVFAQNLRTGEPGAGCRVLVSDGRRVIATGQTSGEGFLRVEDEALRSAADVRVLARRGDSYGGIRVGLEGSRLVEGLRPTGFLYTERPVYRPGGTVHFRGIVRRVEKGRFVFSEGETYDLDIVAPTGDILDTRRVELSGTGTFAGDFDLPAPSPVGSYRLTCRRKDGPVFSRSFEVREFELPAMVLEIEADRSVVLRGETVRGRLRARHSHGGPVAGRGITYRLGDAAEPARGVTDENGVLEFLFDTRDLGESQTLAIHARIEDEAVEASRTIWIATSEFSLSVETLRDVYFAGENFDVRVRCRGLDGEPFASDLVLRALRIETGDPGRGEVESDRRELRTDSAGGEATASLILEREGHHILRVAGLDRFGHRVVAERRIFISGERDEVRLRLVSDTETLRLGEAAPVVLHSRSDAPLAVIVHEGASIHRFRTVRIQEGPNELSLDLREADAPNFRLTAMVLDGNRLHVARKDFVVERGLEVSVEPESDVVTPGDEIAVRLRTRDLVGRDTSAELAVALVDEAVFDLFDDPLPAIRDVFYAQRRGISSVEASSVSFEHRGVTRPVSRVVAEEERLATETGVTPRRPVLNAPVLGDEPLIGSEVGRLSGELLAGLHPDLVRNLLPARFAGQQIRTFQDATLQLAGQAGQVPQQQSQQDFAGVNFAAQFENLDGAQRRMVTIESRFLDSGITGSLLESGIVLDGTGAAPGARRAVLAATAYWNPSVMTDASGRGEIRIRLPERLARWRLVSYGVTPTTLVGRGEATVQTREDLHLEIRHPQAVTEGDRISVEVLVHNLREAGREVDVSFVATTGDRAESFERHVTVEGKNNAALPFALEVRRGERLELEARPAGDGPARTARAVIPILPWATEVHDGAGGVATDHVSHVLRLPEGEVTGRELEITVGPSLESSLLDLAGGATGDKRRMPGRIATASQGRTLLEVLEYLRATNGTARGLWPALAHRLEAILASLLVSQLEGGGWSWTASQAAPDPFVTAEAYEVLRRAESLGFRVPAKYTSAAETHLAGAFARADDATKAVILHALTFGRRADFAALNRLYRMRHSLGAHSLALLALSLERLERDDLAREVVAVLVDKGIFEDSAGIGALRRADPWIDDPEERVALAVLALARLSPRSSLVDRGMSWLQAHRGAGGWSSAKATASAAAALRAFLTLARPRTETYTLQVSVGERVVETYQFRQGARTQRLWLRGDDLPPGDVPVAFRIEGNGRYAYTAILRGRVEGIRRDASAGERVVWHVQRAAPRVVDGKSIPAGFGTMLRPAGSLNTFTELAIGETGTVIVTLRDDTDRERYIVHEEFIPAGCGVVPGSIRGDYHDHEIRNGRLVFTFDSKPRTARIQYDLYGRLPGNYRRLPSRTYPLFRPDRVTLGEEQNLRVLAAGEERRDEYRLTPDELYHIGRLHFERGRLEAAREHLGELFEKFQLKDEIYREVARMLLEIAIAQDAPGAVVRYFEILKERYAELVLSFEDMMVVGGAYTSLGEVERALQVYRGVAEASFIKEGNIAGALKSQGKFLASVEFTERLVLEYPELPAVIEAGYSIAHLLYEASGQVGEIDELRRERLTRVDLIHQAESRLRRFLLFYPLHPKADEAGFTLAAAHLDTGDYERVIEVAEAMRRRFPRSSFLDQYFYIEGYARFWRGEYRRALELLARVEDDLFLTPTGEEAGSEDQRLATYLTAQIYHAMREPERAMEKYRQVSEEFSDAREAIGDFERKALSIPEVTRIEPGREPVLKIEYRNIPSVRIVGYRVDLLKLYLLRRSLDGISDVKLAGIRPVVDLRRELGDGRDYRDREIEVALPVEKAGAYLVVVRANEIDASGMVLVSDLALDVLEDVESGRVRATVLRRPDRAYVSRAHVKVIGEGNERFVSGDTDLRGLFLADGLLGRATVVAKQGDAYAFYRGKTPLGGYDPRIEERAAISGQRKSQLRAKHAAKAQNQKALYESNLRILNEKIQGGNMSQLEAWFENRQEGVEVYRAK